MKQILVAEDEQTLREGIARAFSDRGFQVHLASDGGEAVRLLEQRSFDFVITDLRMPGRDGMEVLRRARMVNESTIVIIVTAFGTVDGAVEAIRNGAFDYIQKPFNLEELELKVERALEHQRLIRKLDYLSNRVDLNYQFENIIGDSAPMKEIFRTIEKVAPSNSTVLITGETGTGKELIAEAIHRRSPRRSHNFVKMNCASLQDNLLESELFGHEKGAFTGADRQRLGRFELAHEGTLLLDEVGSMSPSTQAKVLRVLQEQEFERLGGNATICVDVRVVAATNLDLNKAVRESRFREDLFYRLNVATIHVPALRERREDILPLAKYFADKYSGEMGKPFAGFAPAALETLGGHNWPGNVRELENAVERAILMMEGDRLTEKDLTLWGRGGNGNSQPTVVHLPANGYNLEQLEKDALLQALKMSNWVQKDAAALLGISSRVINYKVQKHQIKNPRWSKNKG
ncbi:MAG: sigma-54-dependent Fis family transcriptional regulator [Acidobacteria bacterium]|nr:sigma-54-dependent Fis family transcriptional regulator [Acidobacteriota bacterium]